MAERVGDPDSSPDQQRRAPDDQRTPAHEPQTLDCPQALEREHKVVVRHAEDVARSGPLPQVAGARQLIHCLTRLVGPERQAPQLVQSPRLGRRVRELLRGMKCDVERVHELEPTEGQRKQRGG